MTQNEIEEFKQLADETGLIYGYKWDSALFQNSGADFRRTHGLISEETNEVVVMAADGSRESSALCDYLEKVSPAEIIRLIDHIKGMQKAREDAEHVASVLEMIGSMESTDITDDVVDIRFELDGVDTGSDVSTTEYALKAAKIIRALGVSNDQ